MVDQTALGSPSADPRKFGFEIHGTVLLGRTADGANAGELEAAGANFGKQDLQRLNPKQRIGMPNSSVFAGKNPIWRSEFGQVVAKRHGLLEDNLSSVRVDDQRRQALCTRVET
jgi:hypothetical protein